MTIRRESIQRGRAGTKEGIGPERFTASDRQGRYFFDNFMQAPLAYKVPAEGAGLVAPGGTALQSCIVDTGLNKFLFATLTDETDQFLPILATDGGYNWVIPATPVVLDGIEINFGGDLAQHPRNIVPSRENGFVRILLRTEDASGTEIFFGYRRAATVVAGYTDITDLFGIRILGNSASTDAIFSVLTQLNNTASDVVETSLGNITGLEDDTNIELEARWKDGKGFLFVNGVPVTGFTPYTADSGDAFSPVLRIIETTDVTAYVKTFAVEGGLLESRSQDTLNALASATA